MKTRFCCLFTALVIFVGVHQATAQGTTAFTYQGQLHDGGTNANGTYTMIFKLYDSLSGGTQIGSAITNSPTLANGLFTVNLDFGAGAFNGSTRWLDITVSNNFVIQTLSPRVQVLADPYAQFAAVAATVTNGAIMNAQLAGSAVASTNIQSGAVTNRNLTANAVNATNIASGQVVKTLNGLTDIVTITNGANTALFTNGNSLIISAGVPNIQLFHGVTSATFTVPANVTRIMVEMWGGGGGGGSGYYAYVGSGGNQNGGQDTGYNGGGGGAGAYAWNVFTVTPGSNYSITAPGDSNGGQNGGTSSISGPGVSMTAGGGSAGSNATASGTGNGGSGGTSTGSILNMQGGGGGGSGNGGGVWRGSSGNSSDGSDGSGPGGGGNGGTGNGNANPGGGGNSGLVIVYY